jgi:hypothetical protein
MKTVHIREWLVRPAPGVPAKGLCTRRFVDLWFGTGNPSNFGV